MAISLSFRTFQDGEDDVQFSSIQFRQVLDRIVRERKEKGEKCNLNSLYEEIADETAYSVDAIINWRKGKNGVSDFQTIKKIASVLHIDYKELIVPAEQSAQSLQQNFEPVGTNEKGLVLQMYQLFVDFIYWFCGTDATNYAMEVLEEPPKELHRYIFNLYHFLDRIVLSVSQETYHNLRSTIAELEHIATSYIRIIYPALWVELNPLLDTDVFTVTWEGRWETAEDVLSAYKEDDDSRDELDSFFHMLLEDRSDLMNKALKLRKEDPACQDLSYAAIIEREGYFPGDMPTYQWIVRETTWTLSKVMRHRFPQFFATEEKK